MNDAVMALAARPDQQSPIKPVSNSAQAFAHRGVEILSTGGICRLLRDEGVEVIEVSDHTGFPK